MMWLANFLVFCLLAFAGYSYFFSRTLPAEPIPEYDFRPPENADGDQKKKPPLPVYLALKDTLPEDVIIKETGPKPTPLNELIVVERVYIDSGKCKIVKGPKWKWGPLTNHFFREGKEIPGANAKIVRIEKDGVTFEYHDELKKLPVLKK